VAVRHSDLDRRGQQVVIDIGEHHAGGLAAQLQGDALDGLGRRRGDPASDERRSGKGDLVHAGMTGELFAHLLAAAGHQVEHTGRSAGVGDGRASSKADSGVSSAGLRTTVAPAARAGTIFTTIWCSGNRLRQGGYYSNRPGPGYRG
jgi:hypothetical protein